MKKNSLKQALLYQEHLLATASASASAAVADEVTATTADADGVTGTGRDESPAKSVKRSTTKSSQFNDSDSSSSDSDDHAVKGDSDPNESDDSSVDVLLYRAHPSNSKKPVDIEVAYNRQVREFLKENGLTEMTPHAVDDIFDALVKILNVTDPDSKSYATTGRLIKYLKKEMKKRTNQSASQSTLSICQKHALKEMLAAYSGGKEIGLRSVRFHVNLLQAISKLLNKSIIVVSPALNGKSSVGLLCIEPTRYHDYQFHDGPAYFPDVAQFDEDTDYGSSDSDHEVPDSKGVADKQPIDEQALIVRAMINFDTNELYGFKPICKEAGDDGLTDTDSDEDDDSVKIVIPTASLKPKPRSREDDPFVTPQPKKQKSNPVRGTGATAPPLPNPYKMQLIEGKFKSSFTAVGESGNHASGGGDASSNSESCVGWGSSPEVLEQLNKKLDAPRENLVLEVTGGITHKLTGKKVYRAIIKLPNKVWYLKVDPAFNNAFALFFKMGPKLVEAPASCFTTWIDSSIRAYPHGDDKVLRRGRIVNGQLPYPKKHPVLEFETLPSGFPIEVVVKHFESTLKSMTSDGRAVATYFLNHLEETGSNLLGMFQEGKFRSGTMKNKPFLNHAELLQHLKTEIEDTFKHGFSKIVHNIHFDKYFTDYSIQQFLEKYDCHHWDELLNEEKSLIYKNGSFPRWEDIVEEPDRAS